MRLRVNYLLSMSSLFLMNLYVPKTKSITPNATEIIPNQIMMRFGMNLMNAVPRIIEDKAVLQYANNVLSLAKCVLSRARTSLLVTCSFILLMSLLFL